MTNVEMKEIWDDYCEQQDDCDKCELSELCDAVFDSPTNEQLRSAMKILNQVENDNPVIHPKHYNRDGAMECLDEMILIFGKETVMNFCLCNVWKYRYRATDKKHEEDIAKSDFYMKKYKELHDDILFN